MKHSRHAFDYSYAVLTGISMAFAIAMFLDFIFLEFKLSKYILLNPDGMNIMWTMFFVNIVALFLAKSDQSYFTRISVQILSIIQIFSIFISPRLSAISGLVLSIYIIFAYIYPIIIYGFTGASEVNQAVKESRRKEIEDKINRLSGQGK